MKRLGCFLLSAICLLTPIKARAILFDFENATQYTPLPIDLTVDGLTAHFSATGQGYSIQSAGVMGFTPQGFAGLCIYPSSVYLSDLLIGFSETLTDFSIMYAPEEYGCDSSALMRVTAYMDGAYVGTNTTTAYPPGTWPTGTLTFTSTQPFNSVVVHYDSPPPTGGDWGPVFMADNMNVTPTVPSSADIRVGSGRESLLVTPNPFGSDATVRFVMARTGAVSVTVYDAQGCAIRALLAGTVLEPGVRSIRWDGRDDRGHEVTNGVYLCRVETGGWVTTTRMILLRTR